MKNILISWVLPTNRQQGGPLPVEEIRGVLIEVSADNGANFSPVGGEFPPTTLSVAVNDLPFSDQYQVRGTVIDTLDQAGNAVVVPFTISDSSPPGDLSIEVTFP
jgi:hypothetical protein